MTSLHLRAEGCQIMEGIPRWKIGNVLEYSATTTTIISQYIGKGLDLPPT